MEAAALCELHKLAQHGCTTAPPSIHCRQRQLVGLRDLVHRRLSILALTGGSIPAASGILKY